jgi:LPS sulfotransferase NodH
MMKSLRTYLRKRYKKYVSGVIAYTFALLKGSKVPSNKFVVYFLPRTGSTLFCSLLNSHPKIRCGGEIFGELGIKIKRLFPYFYLKGQSIKAQKAVYGFKINIAQIKGQGYEPQTFLLDLHQQGWKVIYLKRVNSLRQVVSLLVANTRDEWIGTKENTLQGKIHIDCDELLARMEKLEKTWKKNDGIVAPVPHLTLVYEDHMINSDQHQATLNKVFEYLGVDSAPIHTKMSKTSSSNNLADIIDNYEEVERRVSQSKFAQFL